MRLRRAALIRRILKNPVYCGKIAGAEEDLFIEGTLTLAPEGIVSSGARVMRDVTVFFPRTAPVDTLEISLTEDSTLGEAKPYAIEKPIVYYGSSITQGATQLSFPRDFPLTTSTSASAVTRRARSLWLNT